MRVQNDPQAAESQGPKKSFADELKKLGKPKRQPPNSKKAAPSEGKAATGARKPAAGKPGTPAPLGGKALPQNAALAGEAKHLLVQGAQVKFDASLVRGQKATAHFESSLVAKRAEGEVHRPEIKRVASEIARLLVEPAATQPQPPIPVAADATLTPQQLANIQAAPPPTPPARVEALAGQIEKLIEHAELISRAEGPALSLGLSEGSAARIEVVRTGKGEVALRLDARSGSERRALSAQVGAIRTALASRGLKVRELRVC
jgi:hypothetical protein